MALVHAEAERTINATPQAIFAVVSDYRVEYPRILPAEHFLDYSVDKGGLGAGTQIHFRLRAAGRERPYKMEVTEPAAGRVLRERDLNSSLVTTWTLTSIGDGQRTRVQIATEWEGGHGIGGFFERTFAPGGLRRIYNVILDRLANAVSGEGTQTASATR